MKCVTAQSGRDRESRDGGGRERGEAGVSEGDDSYQMITCHCYVMMESVEACSVCLCVERERDKEGERKGIGAELMPTKNTQLIFPVRYLLHTLTE